ncbi:MAG: flippase-like domain-containing protein [Acidobacteriota bacterium]|nr:flippase-like domain-containing protein [Acidobacteriota bacterium]
MLRALVSAALIAFVLRRVSWSALTQIIARADPSWLAFGWALTPFLILGLAGRWRIFVVQQGLDIPPSRLFFLTWAGQFFNSMLPGSTGGDVVKIYQLCRFAPQEKAAAAATVFADRLSALFALTTMCGIALAIDPVPLRAVLPADTSTGFIIATGLGLALLGVAVAWLGLRFLRTTSIGGRIERTLRAAQHNLRFSAGSVAALLASFALHILNFSIIYSFCRALHLTITYPQVLLMMPVLLFIVLLPVTINGHGLRELLLVAYFTHFSVSIAGQTGPAVQEMAVAVSVVTVANDLLWSLPGGLLYLSKFSKVEQR